LIIINVFGVSHCRLMPFDEAGWRFVQTSLCRRQCGQVAGKPGKVNPHTKEEPTVYRLRLKQCHSSVVCMHKNSVLAVLRWGRRGRAHRPPSFGPVSLRNIQNYVSCIQNTAKPVLF